MCVKLDVESSETKINNEKHETPLNIGILLVCVLRKDNCAVYKLRISVKCFPAFH